MCPGRWCSSSQPCASITSSSSRHRTPRKRQPQQQHQQQQQQQRWRCLNSSQLSCSVRWSVSRSNARTGRDRAFQDRPQLADSVCLPPAGIGPDSQAALCPLLPQLSVRAHAPKPVSHCLDGEVPFNPLLLVCLSVGRSVGRSDSLDGYFLVRRSPGSGLLGPVRAARRLVGRFGRVRSDPARTHSRLHCMALVDKAETDLFGRC
jgi:hypothetical protein